MTGFGFQLAVVYAGGFLTAFTPCVYPLIPVTLGLLGIGRPGPKRPVLLPAFLFVLGLAVVYSTLGLVAATTGRFMGSLTQTPAVALSVALVFFVMGLGMLGAFEFRLPAALTRRITRLDSSGHAGAFVVGATSGILAAPCSGPVVVGILAYVAKTPNPLLGPLLLFVFSLGFGTPFLLLAAFSRYLTRLPKSGAWTEGVKHLAGIALVTASILFLRSYLSVEVFRATILALMLFVVGFASRLFPGSFHKVVRITVAGLIPLVLLSLRPEIRPSGVPGIPWLSSERQGLASARSSRKPVVIDFWAQWCAACVDLDRETYADPRVEKEIRERFIAVKIDATDDSDEVRALMGKYRVVGLPTVLFADADGKVFQEQTVNGFVSAEELLAVLEKVRAGLSR